jgi:hypothetical protein
VSESLGTTLPATKLNRGYLIDGLVCHAVKLRTDEPTSFMEQRHLLVDGEQDSVVGGTSWIVSHSQTSIFTELVPLYIEVCYQAAGSDQSKSLLRNLHSHIDTFRCFVPTASILRLDFSNTLMEVLQTSLSA